MWGRRRRSAPVLITVHRAAQRYRSEQPGIVSWYSFSAGAHYEPGNLSFGSLIGVDEHVLDPGAGFDRHAHRDVAIVTSVIEGALRHQDSTGADVVVEAGQAAVQIAGNGVEHVEANASTTEPVRFVQTTVLCDAAEPSYRIAAMPARIGSALIDDHRAGPLLLEAPLAHLFVVAGEFTVEGHVLVAGDSMRVTRESPKIDGSGELLVTLLR